MHDRQTFKENQKEFKTMNLKLKNFLMTGQYENKKDGDEL
jgi:hypothetical protein